MERAATLILENLNQEQREAASYVGGPILVFAGAGSGKTRVLTHRIAYLVACGVRAHNILAITFTNKAAEEVKERVRNLLGSDQQVWISTFHSFCARILRKDGHLIGLDRSFTIYDSQDQMTVMKEVVAESNLDDKRYQPGAVLAAISDAKNELVGPEQFAGRANGFYEERLADLYKRYQRRLNINLALDFDDLLIKAVELFQSSNAALSYYQDRFQHILVDEYQDTNRAQYVLVDLLAKRSRQLFVVGDDDQNIYTFRGASLRNILEFEKDYPEAKVVRLEQNYRSTPDILDAANHLISNNAHRVYKRLWTQNPTGPKTVMRRLADEYAEAQFVIGEIYRLRPEEGLTYSDFAALYRTHAQSRVLEECLIQREIPYVIVGGIRFYERKEIKDVLAHLRLIAGSKDFMSLKRIINLPRRGIGEVTLAKLEQFARDHDLGVMDALRKALEIPDMSTQARTRLAGFADLMSGLIEDLAGRSVFDTVDTVLQRTGYVAMLEEDGSIEAQTRLENIKEFLSVALEFDRRGAGGLEEFLEGVALVSNVDTMDEDKDAVVLMTLHSAKGLEFPVVFLVGLEEGVFPHMRSFDTPEEIEEERRLCYVGMTRARKRLYLLHTEVRTLFGRTEPRVPSRFIAEIPPELMDLEPPKISPESSPKPPQESSQPKSHFQRGAYSKFEPAAWTGESDFVPGDRVLHPKLGPGMVVARTGAGPETEITVAFPDKGVKTLIARYANLHKE
jgi:DNA helicase-2/ATP-dependent DNA helicase PcrA